MAQLEHPAGVITFLKLALTDLSAAHRHAGEQEDGITDLVGNIRDMIFGLSTSVEALVYMLEEQYVEEVV